MRAADENGEEIRADEVAAAASSEAAARLRIAALEAALSAKEEEEEEAALSALSHPAGPTAQTRGRAPSLRSPPHYRRVTLYDDKPTPVVAVRLLPR